MGADILFVQFDEWPPAPEVEGPADLPVDRVGPVCYLLALLRGSEGLVDLDFNVPQYFIRLVLAMV